MKSCGKSRSKNRRMKSSRQINEASASPNLRYSLPFLPVSETIIGALAEAPGGVRAVVGLLTAGEMQSRRPRWSVPTAQGYAPLRAASNCREV